MSTYREAIHFARSGGTAKLGSRVIRFLTPEESEPIVLTECPSRRVVHDEKTGKPIIENGEIVVETYAETSRPQRFGLYDVSQHPPVKFQPTDDDMHAPVEHDEEGNAKARALRTDWEIVKG